MERGKVIWKLFISTLYLSAFTFGGGYVIITLMKKKFVDEYHWIDEEEMLDLVAIAQSAPGPIAVNGAIVIGYKLAGVPGLLVSILGTVTPPFVILSIVSLFYTAFRENLYIGMMLEGMQARRWSCHRVSRLRYGRGNRTGEKIYFHSDYGSVIHSRLFSEYQRRLYYTGLRCPRRRQDAAGPEGR